MDLTLNAVVDIVKLLCDRLRKERFAQQMTQADVAARSSVGVNTVSNLETGKNVGFENLVKVAMVLDHGDALERSFKPKIDSLDDILRYKKSATRQWIKRENSDTWAS